MLRHGSKNTSKMRSATGEDGYSILYGANVSDDQFYIDLPYYFSDGIWVSFNVAPGQGDFVFRLPAMTSNPKDMETVEQVAQCNVLGIEAVRKGFGE
jgi:hypothetical protein